MAQPVETVARPLHKNLLNDFNETVEEVVPAKQEYPIMEAESQWRTEAYEPPHPFFMHSDFLGLEEKESKEEESKSPLVDGASGDDAWC